MGSEVSEQIARLTSLSRQELLELWQRNFKRSAPPRIRRELLVPCLAYRIQELAYGGLKPSTLVQLRRSARNLKNNARGELLVRPQIKVGTRLHRRWRRQMHEVSVSDSGFEYRGAIYRSLSEVARTITGTRWSGPAFFGLKKGRATQGMPSD